MPSCWPPCRQSTRSILTPLPQVARLCAALPLPIRVISCAATVWLYPRESPASSATARLMKTTTCSQDSQLSHEGAGTTDKRISTFVASSSTGPPADLLPLSTPSNPEAASGSRRCSAASAVSEQPSSASSPAYLSATVCRRGHPTSAL
jgi:hypothetical protein